MKAELLKETYLYGIIPPKSQIFNDFDFYENDSTLPSVYLKKVKIWFGKHKNSEKVQKSLLGIQCWYVNLMTNLNKETEYHGCVLSDNNKEIESKELEINLNEYDYFNKINIGYDYYITHFKITTKKGKYLEFGEIDDNYEKKLEMNSKDNMILFFMGYFSSKGIRAIRIKYIKRLHFVFYRIFDILKIRYILKRDEKKKEAFLDKTKDDKSMKCILKTCLAPDTVFSSVIKFL